jgi:hypothetical protein
MVAGLEEAARQFLESSSAGQAGLALGAVRRVVQRECDCDIRRQDNRALIEGLLRRLDGLEGEECARLSRLLLEADRGERLPADLSEQVEAARATALADADRRFALEAAAGALRELGYHVGEDFSTAVVSGGAIAMLPQATRHGLNVREHGGRLLFNVVRFDPAGRRDPAGDAEAERHWCHDLGGMKERMLARGCELGLEEFGPAGDRPLQVLHQPPPLASGAVSSAAGSRPAEREAGPCEKGFPE